MADRNDPCPCGNRNPDGSPRKYKKCCLPKDERKACLQARVLSITRADFISGPYKGCPKCDKPTFGVWIGTYGNSYSRECSSCGFKQAFSLPKLKKKIIYLDQFLISNMAKALDPKARGHDRVVAEGFWLEAYKKLDRLMMLNLVVCPDSSFHTDESLLCGDPPYDSLKKVYERLSTGATFYDHHVVLRFQVQQQFENYLAGDPDKSLDLSVERIVHGELHDWLGRIRVGVNMPPYEGKLESVHKERNTQYENLKTVFTRWQGERHRNFMDWFREEAGAFGIGTVRAHVQFLERRNAFAVRYAHEYAQGKEPEAVWNDIFPPPSSEIIESLLRIAHGRGFQGEAAIKKVKEYLSSQFLFDIPSIHISSLLLAGLARRAALGQKEPPNKGTLTDINAISNLLPYCDAIFVDNYMAAMMREEPIKAGLARYPGRVFSMKTNDEFLKYLDDIEAAADPGHMVLVSEAYGEHWAEPNMRLLQSKANEE